MHDITSVLLEPKFIDSLIVGSRQPQAQLLTEEHCKFMLKDIATCSLMRLDEGSMDKLWNLMTMLYKWQLFHTQHQYQLMDITFRHLADVAKLYPDEKRLHLIDFTKNTLLDFWNSCSDEEQQAIYWTNKEWLEGFHTKISLLIRLGFQALDGTFFEQVDQTYFHEFRESIGDNIYVKSSEVAVQRKHELAEAPSSSSSANCVNQLAQMLSYSHNAPKEAEDLKPLDFKDFQQQFEKNLQQCNILFEDLDVNVAAANSSVAASGGEEFVYLNPTHNKQNLEASSSTNFPNVMGGDSAASSGGLNKSVLDMYSKLN